MKYKEILGLYEYFQPTYDITNEKKDYWKQFIPTHDFIEILKTLLNSLESNNPKEKKSLWIQGTYGTGKSHATAVVKHLLSDPIESISDFIEKIPNSQLVGQLKNFRKENRVFPVAIKGVSGIYDHKTFKLTLEKKIKEALMREGIKLDTKEEFSRYVEFIENTDVIEWNKFFEKNQQLKTLVHDKNGLKDRLNKHDNEVLVLLEQSLARANLAIPLSSTEQWLTEVIEELKNKSNYTHLIIYWDEFTSVLEIKETSGILNMIQSIAEMTSNTDIFLFLISHRHPYQTKISFNDIEKVLGRFHYKDYRMENITTYHVISNSIRKKDPDKWKSLINELFDFKFENLLWRLSDTKDSKSRETLKNVFPLHPYTAFLANKISELIGSTNRSIFNFLHDEKKGFKKFIEDYPKKNNGTYDYFLTPDYLWDFFLDEFKRNLEDKFYAVMEKSKFLEHMKNKGEAYEAIYKGILLLNILTSYTDIAQGTNEPYLPSQDNLKGMFLGTSYENEVDNILKYINENGYISRGPNDLFLVFLNVPNLQEFEAEKTKVIRELEDISDAFDDDNKNEIFNYITSNVLRSCECEMYGGNLQYDEIRMKLQRLNLQKESYKLKIATFVSKNEIERDSLRREINKLIQQENITEQIIIIIFDETLGEKNYEKLIEYQARINLAKKSSNRDEEITFKKYAKNLISQWINEIKRGYCEIFYKEQNCKLLVRDVENKINNEISQKYFFCGPENLNELKGNINIWRKDSRNVIDSFVFSYNLNDLEERLKKNPESSLRGILKSNAGNYIVDRNLNFIQDIPQHPIFRISKEINRIISSKENSTFNLADELEFLRHPPYGLYPNMISSAIIAFSMRPFINKLYEEGTGTRITQDLMRDKISSLLTYWKREREKDRLNFRLGTQEEAELIEILADIFKLKPETNLNKIKWGVREWIKNIGYPPWSLKYYKKEEIYKNIAIVVNTLITTIDRDLSQEIIIKILNFIKANRTDIILSIDKEKFKKGFINWLNQIVNLTIEENEVDEIIVYLRYNLQDEIALWTEDKVQLKIQEWLNKKKLDKIERDFINTLEEIFKIENSINIDKLKEKVIDSINSSIKFPLWVFKFSNEDDQTLYEAIENILAFLKSEHRLAEDVILKFLDNIKARKNHLSLCLNNEKATEFAINWAKRQNIEYPDEFIDYVKKNLDISPYYCTEKDFLTYKNEFLFIKSLSKVLDLNRTSSLKEFKEDLVNYFDKLNIPFWIFNYDDEAENIRIFLDSIGNFVKNGSISSETIDVLKQLISEKIEEIKKIINYDRGFQLFKNWLNKKVNLQLDNIDKILTDLKSAISLDDFIWNKDKVENWIFNHLNALIDEQKRDLVKRKIRYCNKDLKEILCRIIDEYPDFAIKIDKYL